MATADIEKDAATRATTAVAPAPIVWAMVRLRGAPARTGFTLLALSVDGTSLIGPGIYADVVRVPVPFHLISDEMNVYCAVKAKKTGHSIALEMWSSSHPDNPNTEPDERWTAINGKKTAAKDGDTLEISGVFNPATEQVGA